MQTATQALDVIAKFPITDERGNQDAFNMRKIARDALKVSSMTAATLTSHPGDHYDNLEVDSVAQRLRQRQQGGKALLPWAHVSNASKKKWIDLAVFTLDAFRLARQDSVDRKNVA